MFTHYGPKSAAEKWRDELHSLRRSKMVLHRYPKPQHPDQQTLFDATHTAKKPRDER